MEMHQKTNISLSYISVCVNFLYAKGDVFFMPIYKMKGSKNGKQKYRVRINYTDAYGKAKQIDRVTYGSAEAKELERILTHELKNQQPIKNITINDLHKEYIKAL